jgi:hypothetical protein
MQIFMRNISASKIVRFFERALNMLASLYKT